MSGAAWKPDKDLCRCCLGEGSYHNLAEPRFELGQSEVYVDMLKSCLDIEITPVEGVLCSTTYTICESCILRLRDASNFKKQVVLCEARFKVMYEDYQKSYKNILQALRPQVPQPEVKEEAPATFDTDVKVEYEQIDDDEEGVDLKFDDSDDDEPVIKIKVEHTKKKGKTKTKTRTKSKRKKLVKNQDLNDESAEMDDAVGDEDIGDEGNSYEEDGRKAPKSRSFLTAFKTVQDGDGIQFECDVCERRFNRRVLFSQHYKYVHLKLRPKRYKCRLCGYKYTAGTRAKHMEEAHDIPAPICNICDKKFAHPFLLIQHQKSEHLGEKNYICNVCDKGFGSSVCLRRHKMRHSNVRIPCPECQRSFKQKNSLQVHMKSHHGHGTRVHTCPICEEPFNHLRDFKLHVTVEHPELC